MKTGERRDGDPSLLYGFALRLLARCHDGAVGFPPAVDAIGPIANEIEMYLIIRKIPVVEKNSSDRGILIRRISSNANCETAQLLSRNRANLLCLFVFCWYVHTYA